MNHSTKLVVYALGIFVCYFYYGVLQEKIIKGKYGEGEQTEKFTCTLSLVLVQCIVNYIFAAIILATVMPQGEDDTHSFHYAASALTYLLAMVCSNMSLQWVNYPTQVVGKSCKPIPVMVLGVLFGKKSYPLKKYLFVVTIVLGVALFMYKDGKVAATKKEAVFGIGEVLLFLSLTMDGLTGAVQERMRADHQTKSGHMMLSMNKWSVGYLAIAVILTGEGMEFLHFVHRHPNILWHILSFSLASAVGQFFIFLTVAEFGPLPCSTITTTRKFFTVLGSVIIFGNELVSRQWLGAIFVFTGITLDSIYGKAVSKKQ